MGIDRKTLEQIVETYRKYADRSFIPVSQVSSKQLLNARNEYALETGVEEAVALLDTTMFLNGKKGFLLTETKLYSSDFASASVDLSKIIKVEISAEVLKIYYYDGTSNVYQVKKYGKEVASLLLAVAKNNLLLEMETLKKEEAALRQSAAAVKKASPAAEESAEELYKRAEVLIKEKNYKEAFVLVLKSAEKEYRNAQGMCGLMYYKGAGVKKSFERAEYWFKTAAENGVVQAMYYYGLMLYNCEAIGTYEETAASWLKKAAENGCEEAGTFLKNEVYCSKNSKIVSETYLRWAKVIDSGNEVLARTWEDAVNHRILTMEQEYMEFEKETEEYDSANGAFDYLEGKSLYLSSSSEKAKSKALEYIRRGAEKGCKEAKAFLEEHNDR